MKTYTYLLALWLFAGPGALHAKELPIVFARSGQKVTLSVGADHGKTMEAGALWAFGQLWGEPAKLKNGTAELVAPKVRVPIVFQVIQVNVSDGSYRRLNEAAPKYGFGEVVVYPERLTLWPDRITHWDKDTRLAAVGTPPWFDTWSEAVGLPVRKFNSLAAIDGGDWRLPEKPAALILGRTAENSLTANYRLGAICRRAAEHKVNVLMLDTDWYGTNETVIRKMAVSPKDMAGALTDLRDQSWSLPPTFGRRVLEVANRQTWIAGPEHPFVEEIRGPGKDADSLRIVLSYLPWQQQLGRTEMADELFLRLLTETAKGANDRPPLNGRWRLLYPTAKDIKAGERPVLASALKAAETDAGGKTDSAEIRVYVLDLQGKTPPAEFFEGTGLIKTAEGRIGGQSPLLILGDSPVLDSWKWLELDRTHRRSPRPGVLWWPDRSLPSSIDSQLRLMQLFTEWNISLGDTSQE